MALSPEVIARLEEAGLPADLLTDLVSNAVAQGVQAEMAKVLPGFEGQLQALRPLAERQEMAELDQKEETVIGNILAHPTFAGIQAEPKDVLARMRSAQDDFISQGVPRREAFGPVRAQMAFDRAMNSILLERLNQATPPPPIPAAKPLRSGPPARGGASGAPIPRTQPRAANGQFDGRSKNEIGLDALR